MYWSNFVATGRKYWLKSLAWAFTAWGLSWGLIEPLSAYQEEFFKPHRGLFFAGSIFFVVGYFFFRWSMAIVNQNKISFVLRGTTTKVLVSFGDLFDDNGHTVVSVNNFFDHQRPKVVAPLSVHGQFISRVCGDDEQRFAAHIANDKELASTPKTLVNRADGDRNSYPIGTTVAVSEGNYKYFLFALSNTDPKTLKATCDVPQMFVALGGLWKKVRDEANNDRIKMALIGNGNSGVGVEPMQLLRLILISIIAASRGSPITSEIHIILNPDVADRIDLESVLKEWK